MARFVEDLGLALAIIAGVDWCDSNVIPMPLGDPSAVAIKDLHVAFYTDDGMAAPTPETIETVQRVAKQLSNAGLIVEEAREITERYWKQAQLSGEAIEHLMPNWDSFRCAMLTFIRHYDVIVCPADYRPASSHGTQDRLRFNYTLPYSLTGWPCVVVRAVISPEGLPIGVQVVAGPWREDVVLAVAQHIEIAMGGWQRPPI